MPELPFQFGTIDAEIYYDVIEPQTGSGAQPESLTLVHNFLSTGRTAWSPKLLEQLGERYRMILPDLPGHGRSQGYPERFDHTEMARAVAAIMRREGADRGHLAGCSSGGMVAQLLVDYKMVEPATLTLVSTTHSVSPQTTGEAVNTTPENFRASPNWLEVTAKLHDAYHYAGYFDRELLPGFRRLRPSDAIDLPVDALAAFQMPVCVIHGSQDEFFPLPIAERMAEAAPQGELHVVPDQTHALIFRRPWVVGQLMAEFLGRISGATP